MHQTTAPIDEQAEVDIEVDWSRRFDHMQQHSGITFLAQNVYLIQTAQHLASALAEDKLNAPTVSWALGEKSSTIGMFNTCHFNPVTLSDFGKEGLGQDILDQLEALTNDRIRAALPVQAREIPTNELTSMPELRSRGYV